MAGVRCVCIPLSQTPPCVPQVYRERDHKRDETERRCETRQKQCQPKPVKKEINICEIANRSKDEQRKHNDYDCHTRGEKRQNLINKLKMYLDDCDDRPVLRGHSKGDGSGRGGGKPGFGCLIKYPGYVDYDHPYFCEPYNKMPDLCVNVNQRPGGNPCPPIIVNKDNTEDRGLCNGGGRGEADTGCTCAKRRGVEPRCPAAIPERRCESSTPGYQERWGGVTTCENTWVPQPHQPQPHQQQNVYYCYPLPDTC